MLNASRQIVSNASDDPVLAELVHGLVERLQRGDLIDLDNLSGAYPQYADQLHALLPTIRALADLGLSGSAATLSAAGTEQPGSGEIPGRPDTIGDYRLIREVGRGGMGLVYDAIQISLNRRVALKVLPLASALDSRALARFQRESLAAAQLDHPHIVPVYSVGVDRGVHYYAMRFIDGQSLAQIIADLARRTWPAPVKGLHGDGNNELAVGGCQRDHQPPPFDSSAGEKEAAAGDMAPATLPQHAPGISTDRDSNRPEFYRGVARVGRQAALGLVSAHEHGILHRDIKPGNLLIDYQGKLWITDFGLARIESAGNLTHTGDLLGTLRYMSPEQALGNRGVVDQRTDVYALGATLYELLALEPVFAAEDKADLLRQIADVDPRPLRRIDRELPVDLETVILKCLNKVPADRYATARDLADDLGRFLAHEPIAARSPAPLERLMKWSRRHSSVVSVMAIASGILALAGLGFLYESSTRQRAATALVTDAFEEALLKSGQARARPDDLPAWEAVLASARQAVALANAGPVSFELRERVRRLCDDVELHEQWARRHLAEADRDERMLIACEQSRQQLEIHFDGQIDRRGTADAFARAFRNYGIDVESLTDKDAADRIRDRPIRQQLVLAIIEWWVALDDQSAALGTKLPAIAEQAAAASPTWEKALLAALGRAGDRAELLALAGESNISRQALLLVCQTLLAQGGGEPGADLLAVLSNTQKKYPDEFWTNEFLGVELLQNENRNSADALPFLLAAVALRPTSPPAQLSLAVARLRCGRTEEALAGFRTALQLRPDYAAAHGKLGSALHKTGRLDEAVAELRIALQMQPDDFDSHNTLGAIHFDRAQPDEAIDEFRRAIELKPTFHTASINLGVALNSAGRFDEAATVLRDVLKLKPDDAEIHSNLGTTLRYQGRLAEAIAEQKRAVELQPRNPRYHIHLGMALFQQGRLAEATAAYRRALNLSPDDVQALNHLGNVQARARQFEDAIAAFRRALQLKPDYLDAQRSLAMSFLEMGRSADAEAEYRRTLILRPDDVEAHNGLGILFISLGRWDDAIFVLQRALEFQPKSFPTHIRLAFALRRKGAYRELVETLRRFDRFSAETPDWRYATKEWIRDAERLLRCDDNFAKYLDGSEHPTDAAEQVALSEIALASHHLPALASRWYQAAFSRDPSLEADLSVGNRRRAAAASLAASTLPSDDLDESARSASRRQALEWLTADLEAVRKLPSSPPPAAELIRVVEGYFVDPDFDVVRSPAQLASLPDAERSAWQEFWQKLKLERDRLTRRLQLKISITGGTPELHLEKRDPRAD